MKITKNATDLLADKVEEHLEEAIEILQKQGINVYRIGGGKETKCITTNPIYMRDKLNKIIESEEPTKH